MLDKFSKKGYLEEAVDFGNQTLVYALQKEQP